MDQQKRFILAFTLMMVILFGWMLLNPPKKQNPDLQDTPVVNEEISSDTTTKPVTVSDSSPITLTDSESDTDSEPVVEPFIQKELEHSISTELFDIKFSNRGGVVKSLKLNKYTDCGSDNPERVNLVPDDLPEDNTTYPFQVLAEDHPELLKPIYDFNKDYDPQSQQYTIEFHGILENGLEITKRFILSDNTYSIKLEVELENNSEEKISVSDLRLNWGPGILRTKLNKLDRRYFGPILKVDGKKTTKGIKKQVDLKEFEGNIDWILSGSKYFVVAFKPVSKDSIAPDLCYYFIESEFNLNIGLQYNEISIDPGSTETIKVDSYLGPKKKSEVAKFDENLTDITSFKGIFGFISNIFLELMKFIYKLIPNYGVVIIIITLLIKLVFYPLTHKSMTSMKKMQEVQPILQELQKKYKDDPKKLQEETMRIYKNFGVNPFSGCLPLLIQMPIFIALYTTFGGAIELRCAPFIFWIQDLSSPDTVATIAGFPINILPILMGVAMLSQQMIQGSSQAQSQQTKFLKFLPLVFLIFFWKFPSGLVLYWLMNNIFTIIQTLIINKISDSGK